MLTFYTSVHVFIQGYCLAIKCNTYLHLTKCSSHCNALLASRLYTYLSTSKCNEGKHWALSYVNQRCDRKLTMSCTQWLETLIYKLIWIFCLRLKMFYYSSTWLRKLLRGSKVTRISCWPWNFSCMLYANNRCGSTNWSSHRYFQSLSNVWRYMYLYCWYVPYMPTFQNLHERT